MSVIAYQLEDSDELLSVKIPEGYEEKVDAILCEGEGINLKKLGLQLTNEEVKGIFSEEEFQRLKDTLLTKPTPKLVEREINHGDGSGYQSFLELGKALREKKALDKWKKLK